MKTLLFCLLSTACCLLAEPLTQQERNFAMSHLHAASKRFQDSITGLSEAQWNFKPGPDRWSIAECAEHIVLSEEFLRGMVTDKFLKSPPVSKDLKGNDALVLKLIEDRSQKAQAPEPLRPGGKLATPADALSQFRAARDRTIDYVEKTPDELRSHVMPFPKPLEAIDAYQMILFIAAHSRRHTAQIDEVKADPRYPK